MATLTGEKLLSFFIMVIYKKCPGVGIPII